MEISRQTIHNYRETHKYFGMEGLIHGYNTADRRAIWTHAPVPAFPIAVNTAYLDAAVQERILDALLAMHSKDPDGLKAIDPKYERWVAVDWQAYRPVKETIDRVHGSGFYELKD